MRVKSRALRADVRWRECVFRRVVREDWVAGGREIGGVEEERRARVCVRRVAEEVEALSEVGSRWDEGGGGREGVCVGESRPLLLALDVEGVVKTSSGFETVSTRVLVLVVRLPGDVMKGVRGVLRGVSNFSAVEIRSSSAEEDQSNSSSSSFLMGVM